MSYKMFLNNPPKEWMEGFPLGNGRIAAMVWGDTECDVLSLNHEQLWTNFYSERELSSGCHESMLESVRFLLKEKDYQRATMAANAFFGGYGGISGLPERCDSYQPAGDFCFKIDGVTNYKSRKLELDTGIATVCRETKNGKVDSTFFCHLDKGIAIGHWEGNVAGTIHFERKDSDDKIEAVNITSNSLRYDYSIANGFRYTVSATIKTDGVATVEGKDIKIGNATYLTVYINIATQCVGIEEELRKYLPVNDISYDELKQTQIRIFKKYMDKIDFELYGEESCEEIPLEVRLQQIKNGKEDLTFPVLYFNFGRYLLLSSSFKSKLPANLQGKWNDSLEPAWKSDYHLDINLQMNYWMAEALNMSECSQALFNFVEDMIPHGKKIAKDLYNCRGVYFPLNTDAWCRCTPEACGWSVWVGAAPWLAQHFWWHYTYTEDIEFLKNRAYPIFKEVAEFFEDYLVADENGEFQIMPSCSPENKFKGAGEKRFPVSIGTSAAMDVQLIYDSLGYAIKSAEILNTDILQSEKWKVMREHLPPFGIGSDGRLLEWNEEKEEVEPGHRHISHLYGLYPSDLFNPIDRPEQYEASRKSLEYRLSHNGGYTGWSSAWVTACYARLGEGEKAYENLKRMFTDFSTDTLLDLHPPRIFQIDGNLGQVAAILEMLVQFWGGKLHLLKALPIGWENGKLRGVKIPGGHIISLAWENSKLIELQIDFIKSDKVTVCIQNENEIIFEGQKGESIVKKFN